MTAGGRVRFASRIATGGASRFEVAGGALVAIGAVLHVTASSSVRVVKLSVRLRDDGSVSPRHAAAPGGAVQDDRA